LGLSLMAAIVNWDLLLVILEVAVGLGMVIFVHELGHFAVAKWCGVKCEKFYLGFDIYGLKLAKFQWGETEYGIGILPLGGYVKMLGQDDNPAHAAQERERSRLQAAHEGAVGVASTGAAAAPGDRNEGDTIALDPRSYMAKSVPQRMAIISAGVIMNVIFAVIMAVVAYSLGVREVACGISAVLPGEAAWKANLQPGDRILEIDDSGDRQLRFRDLRTAVMLANLDVGVNFLIERQGVDKPFLVNVKPDPDKKRLRPTIGVAPPLTTTLRDDKAAYAETPAAETGKFKPRDKIVAIDDAPIAAYPDLLAELTRHQDQPVRVKVERTSEASAKDKENQDAPVAVEILEIEVPPRPMRTLGLVMKMGKITAVQADSPAAAADIRAGDFITAIDGQPPADPIRLPDELRRRAGETITLAISRDGPSGQDEKLEKQIVLRDWRWPEESSEQGTSVSVPALGLTYGVLNIVHQTDKDSPAAVAQLTQDDKPAAVPLFAAGDEIVRAEFLLPKVAADEDNIDIKSIEFSADKANWPLFNFVLQLVPADTKVKLTLKDGRTATLGSAAAEGWFMTNRGFALPFEIVTVKAHSFREALSLGFIETRDAVLQVYMFLRKIGSQISLYSLGGPKTIAQAAGYAAYDGVAQLLLFLTLLSANLAVINFLPIPLLDGGHMVFLILEGVLRRPVSEKVVVAFHYVGFLFIISLMLFVLGLDFGLIPRPH
jgi:regulator of sigma E protease